MPRQATTTLAAGWYLQMGSRGHNVKILQTLLNHLLRPFPPLVIDGEIGPKTVQAVRSFQAAMGLKVDGIVGPLTWAALTEAALALGDPLSVTLLDKGVKALIGTAPAPPKVAASHGAGRQHSMLSPSKIASAVGSEIAKGVSLAFRSLANAPSPIAEAAVRIALTQRNVQEGSRNNNHGVTGGLDIHGHTVGVDDYNAAAHYSRARDDNTLGPEWCCSFVYWCFDQASQELNQANPLQDFGKKRGAWGYVPDLYNWAKQNHKLVPEPQRGDIFILRIGGEIRHTGLVASVAGKIFHTIEGNSGKHINAVVEEPRPIQGHGQVTFDFVRV